jgi:SAM-dependent methyltransferase
MPTRIEEWDQRYRAGEQVFETPAPLVVEFTGTLLPGSALDLACGPGRNALYLAERGWRVTALDGSPVAIELLRGKKPSIDARVVDLESGELELPSEAYDLVLSCYYLQRSLIPGMQSALRPGGLLIAIAHLADVDQPRGTPTRVYPGELRAFFKGWRILYYREGEPGEQGHRHAVAELVASR